MRTVVLRLTNGRIASTVVRTTFSRRQAPGLGLVLEKRTRDSDHIARGWILRYAQNDKRQRWVVGRSHGATSLGGAKLRRSRSDGPRRERRGNGSSTTSESFCHAQRSEASIRGPSARLRADRSFAALRMTSGSGRQSDGGRSDGARTYRRRRSSAPKPQPHLKRRG
jgi:hypothetical protein